MITDLEVKALLKAGRHAEAAEALLAAGDPRRAMGIFAEVWMYDRAVGAARAAGDLGAAVGFALQGKDRRAAEAIVLEIARGDVGTSRRTAETLAANGEHLFAADLFAAAGDDEAAARVLTEAGEPGRAAMHLERAGRMREAGIACEARLQSEPHDADAAVRLGRILLSFGRAEAAARAALRVTAGDALEAEALRLLVRAFAALGHPVAARERLVDLRRVDPAAPESLLEPPSAGGPDREEGRWLAGRWRIEKLLGGGSVGRVYRAHDALTNRAVAIKVFGASTSGASGRDAYGRFAREASVAAQIDHPHVVRVLEFNEEGPFLVMELCDGTLEDRLGERLPLGVVRAVARGVLGALEAVHRRGIVHRDVKPANVFFAEGGVVKLGDFGTAHLLELGQTQTGGFLGTLAYMAPEQVTGGRVDASTDLYALGLVLYRCLTGVSAMRGADLVTAQLGERPDPPSARRPVLGSAFDVAIARAIEKDPAARFRTAAEMLAALDAIEWKEPDGEAAAAPAAASAAPVEGPLRWEERGGDRLHDRVLDRTALRVRFASDQAERVQALALEPDPALQVLYDADFDRGEALLEWLPGPEVDDDAPVAAARARLASIGLVLRARARDTDGGPVLPVEEAFARSG